jgi:hypothetical protein
MALTDLGALDMVLWRTSHDFTQDVVHFIQDMAHVMQSVGSHDDLTHSDTYPVKFRAAIKFFSIY